MAEEAVDHPLSRYFPSNSAPSDNPAAFPYANNVHYLHALTLGLKPREITPVLLTTDI